MPGLNEADGRPSDVIESFSLDDDDDEVLAARLAATGYLHITGVLVLDEVPTLAPMLIRSVWQPIAPACSPVRPFRWGSFGDWWSVELAGSRGGCNSSAASHRILNLPMRSGYS